MINENYIYINKFSILFNAFKHSNLYIDPIGREVSSKTDLTQSKQNIQQVYHTYSFVQGHDFVCFFRRL